MTPKIGAALAACSLIASVLAPGASNVAAAGDRHAAIRVHHIHRLHTKHYLGYRPLYGYYTRGGQYVPGAGDTLMNGPGYVYVPGRGILGASCDLPSSTCSNEYRDIQ